MKTVVTILVFSFMLFIDHAEAQYSEQWFNSTGGSGQIILSIENTDNDPQKEILVGWGWVGGTYSYPQDGLLTLFDGLTGEVEWKSNDNFENVQSGKLIDVNGDGIFEILFVGKKVNTNDDGWFLYGSNGVSITEISKSNIHSSSFPNPFKQSTTIKYTVPKNGTFVSLKIFDSYGTELKTLVNDIKNAGEYEILFNGFDLSNGMYFYQVNIGNSIGTKKMIKME
ncbi:MAG: T9SS type A sorting domain-containing protein [Bacteroidales bacterium]|jgi:hypothetical protein|nr:T9SS type A sorting domain-containing protein [Bacteroidales bacterium]